MTKEVDFGFQGPNANDDLRANKAKVEEDEREREREREEWNRKWTLKRRQLILRRVNWLNEWCSARSICFPSKSNFLSKCFGLAWGDRAEVQERDLTLVVWLAGRKRRKWRRGDSRFVVNQRQERRLMHVWPASLDCRRRRRPIKSLLHLQSSGTCVGSRDG
jgi:hypothetical protein